MSKEGLLDLFKKSRNGPADQERETFNKSMKFRVAVLEERVGMDSGRFYAAYSNGLAPDSGSSTELANRILYQLREFNRKVA